MSSVKITGNASGTGVFTVESPNSNTDRTLTLPDGAGTVAVSPLTASLDLNGNELILDVDGDTSITSDSDDQIDFKTGGTDRMHITTVGRVGIGTNSPRSDLEVAKADSGDGGELTLKYTGNSGFASIKTDSSNQILFSTNATSFTERMRIDSVGRALFFCTAEPATSVSGAGFTNNQGELRFGTSGTGNTTRVRFYNPNGEVGAIRTNGSATAYHTSSDYRIKQDVVDMTGAIDRLKTLSPKRFAFKADPSETVDGFLAHEVSPVVPIAVSGTKDEVETWTQQEIDDDDGDAPDGTSAGDNKLDEEGNTIPAVQGLDHSKLVPLLVGALQEAITKIETLETKVAALEAK